MAVVKNINNVVENKESYLGLFFVKKFLLFNVKSFDIIKLIVGYPLTRKERSLALMEKKEVKKRKISLALILSSLTRLFTTTLLIFFTTATWRPFKTTI